MFKGTIIEESLESKSVFRNVRITSSKVEPVTEGHKTPRVSQWTMHDVEIPEDRIDAVAQEISRSLDSKHNWYADFRNDTAHYIVFRDKVFKIDRRSKEQYHEAKQYGISLGIPEQQLDFGADFKN